MALKTTEGWQARMFQRGATREFAALTRLAPSGEPLVLDIGGLARAGVRAVGRCAHAFVVPVNLSSHNSFGLAVDGAALDGVPAASCDGIFSSHMIEHVVYNEADAMLARWREVLKPGGWLEIRCPDAEWLAREAFVEHRITATMYTELLLGKRIDGAAFYEWCHQNVWWFDKLQQALSAAGFADIQHVDDDTKWLDWWPYDLSETSHHGQPIKDLHVTARRPL